MIKTKQSTIKRSKKQKNNLSNSELSAHLVKNRIGSDDSKIFCSENKYTNVSFTIFLLHIQITNKTIQKQKIKFCISIKKNTAQLFGTIGLGSRSTFNETRVNTIYIMSTQINNAR